MPYIHGAKVLIDNEFKEGLAVEIEKGLINSIIPVSGLEPSESDVRLHGGYLCPGFIDIQVNGGGGVLFNDDPSVECIKTISKAHRKFGTTSLLPTLISDKPHIIKKAILAVQQAIDEGVPGILGLHIEGPFLNQSRKGVHNEANFLELSDELIDLVSSLKNGRTIVTLAPETVKAGQISSLVKNGVIVAAGHTDASYETINEAILEGLSGFTHLYNAMSQLNSRSPGVVGAALDSPNTWAGLIVDMHHVHSASIRIASKIKGPNKTILVTDAMSTVGAADDMIEFELFGNKVKNDSGKLTIENGSLAGSAIDMMSAVSNTVNEVGIPLVDALTMASKAPAAAIGLSDKLGSIQIGLRADFVHISDDFKVLRTWINGV